MLPVHTNRITARTVPASGLNLRRLWIADRSGNAPSVSFTVGDQQGGVVPGPMRDVKVVELGVWVAGPATAGILADWGAEVVKIEPIGGDPARIFQFLLGGDMPTNPVFEMDNRSKRGIAVDLSTDDGLTVLWDLLAEADVFVQNFRPGAAERLGVAFEDIRALRPDIVYADLPGFGPWLFYTSDAAAE